MRPRLLATSAAVLAALVATIALPATRGVAATSWTNTATQATSLASATSLGALPATQQMHINVALKLRNQAALNQYIHDINTPGDALYGSALTTAQFVAQYAPTGDQVQAVTGYLTSQGLTNVTAAPNNLFVSADGTAAQIEAAFNTQLGLFSQQGATVYANTTAAQVPSALGGIVLSVLGLNNASVMRTPLHAAKGQVSPGQAKKLPQATATCAAPSVAPTGPILYIGTPTGVSAPQYLTAFTPRGFQTTYDAGTTATGCATSIAIFAEGDLSGVVQDLRTEEAAFGMPQVPYTIVHTGIASTDTSGADEWDMDTQTSTGIAETVQQLYIYDATSLTDSDIALEFNTFASQNVAQAGSASFGECEVFPYVDGSMLADDEVFAEAAAQGQTVFASAGDTGGFCAVGPTNGVPAGGPFVNYPASSPYVVAVGGTTLLANTDGSYNNELAWLAGGGGTSAFETQPFWQSGTVPPVNGTVGKALPDIAMDADPNSGAAVYVSGAMTIIGGTSLSSPLALGVWARLESAHNNGLGFAATHLYGLEQSYPYPQIGQVPTTATGYHDVILGDTGPYPATPGYDYATGMGTFDISLVNGLIK